MQQHQQIQELISAYLDNELPDNERLMVNEHLNGCEECRSLFQELSALKQSVFYYYNSIEVPDVENGVMEKIKPVHAVKYPIRMILPLSWAVIALLVASLLLYIFSPVAILGSSIYKIMPSLLHLMPRLIRAIPISPDGIAFTAILMLLISAWSLHRLLTAR
ncbi:Putative zinc-finger [Desulfotomaculum arcticum]|uniref:Anti-sigma-W factor RsiW n=1 Tax=Desulfotruncus arcticus DSM 17038 TaxID=1121424 RepID=A0A1I2RGE8_9FIRM|nr:zf-HC2 domain-containing protein [Desulfotruncus arcticus]SFG39133.1 Putative zinc-finger [Desulfotomaculum arcticum] [Desulfotruncus arcticus DSM 17038]